VGLKILSFMKKVTKKLNL